MIYQVLAGYVYTAGFFGTLAACTPDKRSPKVGDFFVSAFWPFFLGAKLVYKFNRWTEKP